MNSSQPSLVHIGQHYDAEMSDILVDDLGLPTPVGYRYLKLPCKHLYHHQTEGAIAYNL
jgi:UDP-N-acetylglucosamine 2-epimerase